jgi:hypothetical protein
MMSIGSLLLLMGICQAAVVLDRIAVIVGKHVIKASDIDRDLRLTALLNGAPLDLSSGEKRKAAERLIDQELIRQEIVSGRYKRPGEAEAANLEQQFQRDRFGGSESRLRQVLQKYGLSDEQLQEHLLWQLTVLRFIDERFRPGILVSDEEVRSYYDQHLEELRRQHPRDYRFDSLKDVIQETIVGERINIELDQWLKQARNRYRIEYKQEAFA